MAEEAPPYAERLGARLPPGTLLADRYCIESILGAGAFGVVWRARHVHLETECAVKLFEPRGAPRHCRRGGAPAHRQPFHPPGPEHSGPGAERSESTAAGGYCP